MSTQETSIAELVAKGRELLDENGARRAHREFKNWVAAVSRWLDERAPESGSSAVWSGLPSSPLIDIQYDRPEHWAAFREAVQHRLAWLGQIIPTIGPHTQQPSTSAHRTGGRRVFVVHGHNEAVRESTARLLERLGLEPIILHEQPNRGRTIIEKFVEYADAAFAVVLLTGDDRGGPSRAPVESYTSRARQNVLLELGYFLGKLDRERVCALYETGVEIPSDYSGVLFIPLDSAGHWRVLLAKELRAAGLPVDLNQV